jgi:hypothetical protein
LAVQVHTTTHSRFYREYKNVVFIGTCTHLSLKAGPGYKTFKVN